MATILHSQLYSYIPTIATDIVTLQPTSIYITLHYITIQCYFYLHYMPCYIDTLRCYIDTLHYNVYVTLQCYFHDTFHCIATLIPSQCYFYYIPLHSYIDTHRLHYIGAMVHGYNHTLTLRCSHCLASSRIPLSIIHAINSCSIFCNMKHRDQGTDVPIVGWLGWFTWSQDECQKRMSIQTFHTVEAKEHHNHYSYTQHYS
jgi:hypothetical protein